MIGKAAIGGPWTLVNTDGVPVTDQDYKDKFMLVYFGFTFCPDICPNELVKMSHLLDKIGTCSPTMEVMGWAGGRRRVALARAMRQGMRLGLGVWGGGVTRELGSCVRY